MIGYDSKEGYMSLTSSFYVNQQLLVIPFVSAMLQRRRWPDEAQFGMAGSTTSNIYRIQRCECRNQQLV